MGEDKTSVHGVLDFLHLRSDLDRSLKGRAARVCFKGAAYGVRDWVEVVSATVSALSRRSA